MEPSYHQICLFGDSITQMSFDTALSGFGASLADVYQRKMDVVNRGYAGYNTEWGVPILRQLLPTKERQRQTAAQLRLIIIAFGANDAALPNAQQHLPIERFKENLDTMLSMIQSPDSPHYNPQLRIMLVTPPPVNESQWKQRCDDKGDPMNRTAENAEQFAHAVRTLGKERDVVVADFWSRLMERAGGGDGDKLSEFSTDGLHLNANGNQVMYELLIETIETYFPEIHPNNLEMDIPNFRDLPSQGFESKLQFPLLKK